MHAAIAGPSEPQLDPEADLRRRVRKVEEREKRLSEKRVDLDKREEELKKKESPVASEGGYSS